MDSGEEIWKEIPGTHRRYEASSHGRIRATFRSLTGRAHGGDFDDPLVLSQFSGPRGYPLVSLDLADRITTWSVAACMLSAFVSPRPAPRDRATYLDGDRNNLSLSNLAWMTPKRNKDVANGLGHSRRRPVRRIGRVVYYQCNKCGDWRPERDFHPLKGGVSRLGNPLTHCGRNSECRACCNAQRVARRRTYGDGGAPSLLEQITPVLQLLDGQEISAAEMTPKRCGERVANVRVLKGLSRTELSRRAGLKAETVDKLERGENVPRVKTLRKIIEVLSPTDSVN